jgi:cysteine desulfurase
MAVNNETGVMQPIQEIGELLSEAGILFHTDLSQYAGKFTTNFSDLPVDLASFSAHKFYGPKGSGLLFARNRKRLAIAPVISGGGQEFGLRAGTLATHQILGLCAALQVAQRQLDQDYLHIQSLKEHLIKGLAQIGGVIIHGDQRYCSAYITNFSVRGIDASILLNGLADTAAFSNGAACSSGTIDPSHVLRNMGLQGSSLYGAVRVSFGYYNTLTEVELFLQGLQQLLSNLEDKLS